MNEKDHFAAAALTGLLANPTADEHFANIPDCKFENAVAHYAYEMADAMMKEQEFRMEDEPCEETKGAAK